MRLRLPDSLSPLRERPYRLLWTARTVSSIGDAPIPITIVFAILRSGGGAGTVGEVLTCEAVGQVVMLPGVRSVRRRADGTVGIANEAPVTPIMVEESAA